MLIIVKEGTLSCTQSASPLLKSVIYIGEDLIFCPGCLDTHHMHTSNPPNALKNLGKLIVHKNSFDLYKKRNKVLYNFIK